MEGWIKLHRKILEWEWYGETNVFRLFLHLLLIANHAPNKWKGVDVGRGQAITSIGHLAKNLQQTIQQTRTSLIKLKSTNEITIKTTSKYSLITLINYDRYQSEDTKVTNKITNEITSNQQTNNKQNNKRITTNKNDNNIIIISKDITEPEKPKKKKERDVRIDELIMYFEGKIGSTLDGTQKGIRFECYRLIKKMEKEYKGKDPVVAIKVLIDIATDDEFHSKNATNFRYITNNIQRLIRVYKEKVSTVAVI